MARSILAPAQRFAKGRREFNVPLTALNRGQGLMRAGVRLQRNNWPDTGSDVVRVQVLTSEDGGTTWTLLLGFTAGGGEVRNRDGSISTETSAFRNPDTDKDGNPLPRWTTRNTRRRMKVVIEPLVDLDTAIDAELV